METLSLSKSWMIAMKTINTIQLSNSFIKLLESLNENDLKIQVNDNWTVKDVITHLVDWEEESTKQLPLSWKFHKKPWFMTNNDDFKDFNSESLKKYKNMSKKQLISEWKKWQSLLQKEIDKIGEEKLRSDYDFFEWVFDEGGQNHYFEHYDQIMKALIYKNK
ncbi:MAG: hypothetical protein Q8Q30_01390 [Candidatus Woesebacteria bacterium]|nr:hypothetical protein [Candidatus Woesebacteria bacterium]